MILYSQQKDRLAIIHYAFAECIPAVALKWTPGRKLVPFTFIHLGNAMCDSDVEVRTIAYHFFDFTANAVRDCRISVYKNAKCCNAHVNPKGLVSFRKLSINKQDL